MPEILTPNPLHKTRQFIVRLVLVAAGLLLVSLVVLAARWPFRREAVIKDLEDASLSRVDVGSFRRTYFPHVGCVLEHVVFQHNPKSGTPPLITADRIIIESNVAGLFVEHVSRIIAEGLHLLVPPRGSDEHFEVPKRSSFVIDELVADGAVLEVARRNPTDQPLIFVFHRFSLGDVGSSAPASFRAKFSNPEPRGEISTNGSFGPWNAADLGQTAVSGQYVFEHAELGMFPGIAGILSSSGKFGGVLNHIEAQGETDTPDFAVSSSSHQAPLRTQFQAVVNGENGDTFLQKVVATFRRTSVWTEGSIAARAGEPGKWTSLHLVARDGRIQDVLLLFVKSQRAPMSGTVSFQADVSLPPQHQQFLQTVGLKGDFGIDAGSFTKFDTQQALNQLSAGAEKEHSKTEQKDDVQPENVLSNLKGHVLLQGGTARFSSLSFDIPGAAAQFHGTYNLISGKIDLHGTLKTADEPSDATGGIKAVMLKVLEPFFKKKHVGYMMPVQITGTYEHPIFGLDLGASTAPPHSDRRGNL
jgi:AsmA-like C-terminal region